MKAHRRRYPVGLMCRLLEVSRSGFYAWLGHQEGPRAARRGRLSAAIGVAHAESRRLYGSPRVHAALKASGERCCVNTVARLMRLAGLKARTKRKFKATTNSSHSLPVAENLLGRDFAAVAPNRKWVADLTYIPTREGWLYLAAIEDLHSRRVVGWAMDERMTADLAVAALTMALESRRPAAGLIHHSDRGSQYASRAYREVLDAHRLVASMSRKGNCYDNAVMESFFGTLKKELVSFAGSARGAQSAGAAGSSERFTIETNGQPAGRDANPTGCFATRSEARNAIFEYVEVYYNRRRRHSTLDYQTPAEYEQAAAEVT